MRNRNSSRVLLTFVLALAVAVPFLTKTRSVSAQLTGSIFTSSMSGTTVNINTYNLRCDVYLNGGPQNENGKGLPDGNYFFQVTNPSGSILLSTDLAVCREVQVVGGVIAGSIGACPHPNGAFNPANGSTPVQLCPFDFTPNAGGEYKLWLIPVDSAVIADDGIHLSFTDSKTDNFKVKESPVAPQSAIGGVKYYDTNANGMLDPGELGIEGVEIDVTIGNDPPIVTQTDATGTWALVFDPGTQYTVCEVLPADTTYTQTGPKNGATTADNAATANASKCWTGTVLATDTLDLNFFNVTCTPQISCPQDITQCNDATKCSAVVTYTTPTATDNCAGTPTVVCDPASGSTFQKGTTTVTCTATDPHDQTAQCTFHVTVNDCEKPVIHCPDNKVACNDTGMCTAAVSFTTPTATDNCGGTPTVSCDPASGTSFAKGTTTVTCTATDASTNSAQCTFTVTVNDCESPQITCPVVSPIQLLPGDVCPPVVTFTASATDNCDGPITPSCIPASGSTFPVGTTTVNCTATDAAGNPPARCSFSVTVYTSIRAHKFYDANTSGSQDPGEPSIAGWKFKLGSATQFTDINGNTTFTGLLPGNYTVTEVFPGPTWSSTTGGTSRTFNGLTCPAVANFGNVCSLTPGGLTIGFWSNKNGQALETAADFLGLNGLCLKNANGTDHDFTGSLAQNKTNYNNWVLSATATNMAYMLSAQLSATYLNVAHGVTNPAILVDGTRTVADEIVYANSLLCGDGPCTGYLGISTAAGACRTEQERVKTILDKINNGGSFVQPAPCAFTSPY